LMGSDGPRVRTQKGKNGGRGPHRAATLLLQLHEEKKRRRKHLALRGKVGDRTMITNLDGEERETDLARESVCP